MNPVPLLLRWLSQVFSPPRGRHRQGGCPPHLSEEQQPLRVVPDYQPIRMDDPTEPRRYSMIRAPFLRWETRDDHESGRTPVLILGEAR